MRRGLLAGLVVLALAGCAQTGQSTNAAQFALTGTVHAEPGCPGPVSMDTPCPPRPVAGATVEADQDGHLAARAITDHDGRFVLHLAAGTYQVTAINAGGLKTIATQAVTLSADTDIALTVDSGMQ